MNKIQQQIYNQVVKPSLDNIAGNLIAVVKDFDNLSQTGTVSISAPLQKGERYAYDVPLINLGGVKQANPFPGDTVLVTFLGGSYKHPAIIGKADSKHGVLTRNDYEPHFRAGSNVTDLYTEREGETWI